MDVVHQEKCQPGSDDCREIVPLGAHRIRRASRRKGSENPRVGPRTDFKCIRVPFETWNSHLLDTLETPWFSCDFRRKWNIDRQIAALKEQLLKKMECIQGRTDSVRSAGENMRLGGPDPLCVTGTKNYKIEV